VVVARDDTAQAVEDRAGNTLGCLVLDGHSDKRDGDVVLVSQRRAGTPRQPAMKPRSAARPFRRRSAPACLMQTRRPCGRREEQESKPVMLG
jgi:hypothetical protein